MSTETRWLTPQEQRAWRAYLRATRLVEVALDRDLAVHGTQLSEYEVISMLSEAPGGRLRMSNLADMVVQSRSRITHTAARLEKRGLVRREACVDDRRGVEVVLTDDGRAAIEEMARRHVDSVRANLIDILSPEEFIALGDSLRKVRDALAMAGQAGDAD
ncbi:MAG TPA: MarR family transcriptional regulator [Tetrasphaera sp.]|uniref:MarR family winged helix-turn-helix transcriptional regulator n=1 Tax=Nostocoides sp. TaxID=1917966 RepID=UPI002CA65CE6|nr:MarR family transcriptional regulator [Tetrasphaera sp.]HNQ07541.1 MarR family transcriptional regulator [Tetrasphaera sp.]